MCLCFMPFFFVPDIIPLYAMYLALIDNKFPEPYPDIRSKPLFG